MDLLGKNLHAGPVIKAAEDLDDVGVAVGLAVALIGEGDQVGVAAPGSLSCLWLSRRRWVIGNYSVRIGVTDGRLMSSTFLLSYTCPGVFALLPCTCYTNR